jgi:hypothetical protein
LILKKLRVLSMPDCGGKEKTEEPEKKYTATRNRQGAEP